MTRRVIAGIAAVAAFLLTGLSDVAPTPDRELPRHEQP